MHNNLIFNIYIFFLTWVITEEISPTHVKRWRSQTSEEVERNREWPYVNKCVLNRSVCSSYWALAIGAYKHVFFTALRTESPNSDLVVATLIYSVIWRGTFNEYSTDRLTTYVYEYTYIQSINTYFPLKLFVLWNLLVDFNFPEICGMDNPCSHHIHFSYLPAGVHCFLIRKGMHAIYGTAFISVLNKIKQKKKSIPGSGLQFDLGASINCSIFSRPVSFWLELI